MNTLSLCLDGRNLPGHHSTIIGELHYCGGLGTAMRLPSGIGLSVRGITSAVIAALAVLCLTVAGAIAFVAVQLQSTSAALVRDAESLRLVTQIELQLLDYQRLSTFVEDPLAQAERRQVRAELETSLGQALVHAADDSEAALVEQTAADIDAYLRQRDELMSDLVDPLEIQRLARPALTEALKDLDVLSVMNRAEVNRAYARAQRMGSFFILAACVTVLLAAGMLLVMAVAIRHMMLRPVLGLRQAIDRFRSGDPTVSADERAPRELSEIAKAFNEMSAELGRQKAHQLAFIAGVAHDLRNPLTALQYGVDAMQLHEQRRDDRATDNEAQRTDILKLIGGQLDHLARMVNDLLETCAIEAGELVLKNTFFDLRDAAQAVVDLYRPFAPEQAFELEFGDEPARVRADRTRMEQVVGNLVSNAIKYSSSSDAAIRIAVTAAGDAVELAVMDHGIGIEPDEIDKIFRPFWRSSNLANRNGTGLGLSVVRKIIMAHGGSVHVESRPGYGSAFRVRIPLAQAAEHRQAI